MGLTHDVWVDEENTTIIEHIIATLKKEGKTMVIMTTHDREQAARLADRQLILINGRIEDVGRERFRRA